jgi:hypothetical protein
MIMNYEFVGILCPLTILIRPNPFNPSLACACDWVINIKKGRVYLSRRGWRAVIDKVNRRVVFNAPVMQPSRWSTKFTCPTEQVHTIDTVAIPAVKEPSVDSVDGPLRPSRRIR